jgi:hypothetical protein
MTTSLDSYVHRSRGGVLLSLLLAGCTASIDGGTSVGAGASGGDAGSAPMAGTGAAAGVSSGGTGGIGAGGSGNATGAASGAGGVAAAGGAAGTPACDPAQGLGKSRIWRLTQTQIANTLRDALGYVPAALDSTPREARRRLD